MELEENVTRLRRVKLLRLVLPRYPEDEGLALNPALTFLA
jgi:hypothetical protein